MHVKVELCALLFRLAGNVGTIDTSTWEGGGVAMPKPSRQSEILEHSPRFYVTYASA